MNILLTAATSFEIAPLIGKLTNPVANSSGLETFTIGSVKLTVAITGVGMVATAFAMGKHLNASFDCALNAGIAGSFTDNFAIGDVVNVSEDCFSELGAEDGDQFLTIDQLGFGSSYVSGSGKPIINAKLQLLPKVKGITVNKVHGNEKSIKEAVTRFNPATESMEGAAFLFACEKYGLPCAQLRGISNYVERRNKEKWNIPLAVKNLNELLEEILLAF